MRIGRRYVSRSSGARYTESLLRPLRCAGVDAGRALSFTQAERMKALAVWLDPFPLVREIARASLRGNTEWQLRVEVFPPI